jgi:predicted dehydrogenase
MIGKERARAIVRLQQKGHDVELGLVHDPFLKDKPPEFDELRFKLEPDLRTFLEDPADLLIIASPHDTTAEYACEALKRGKHILIEKPMGRNLQEAKKIIDAMPDPRLLNVGFNYRFMAGIRALLKDVQEKRFGELVAVTTEQGHGGRPGDERTWKLDPVRCGGGAMLDPGVHLIDLICLMSDARPIRVRGTASWNGFWNTGIDEDTHALLTADKVTFGMHISVVLWRSSFYIYALGADGYGIVRGRGRSYGPQTYVRGKRWGWRNGPSQADSEELVLTTDCEESFEDELAAVLALSNHEGEPPCADSSAALRVMEIYDAICKGHN